MENFRDEGSWRTVGGDMHVQELSAAERQKAEKAAETRMQQMAEDYRKSVTARRKADAAVETSMDAVIAKASEIKSPMAERAEKLGWVLRPDGSLVHKSRAAQHEPEYEGGPTPAESAELEAWLEEDDEEEDPWR